MTATDNTRHRADSAFGRIARKRWVPIAAAATAAALTAGAIATAGGGTAGAAGAPPQAQSAGNFLDATLGGKPIDDIAKLKFARAEAPGSNGVQNPLDVTVLNALNLPLTGALQLQQLLGITLGAANQVAQAKVDGSSYGAAGAVNNSGGVSVGGNNNAFPANATINLTAAGIAGNSPIPIPGGAGSADVLGGVQVSLGAVSALAQTPKGYAKKGTTDYTIADVNLELGSPLVGALLKTVTSTLSSVVTALTGALPVGAVLPKDCFLATGTLPNLSLEGGAITIDSSNGALTISLDKLLKQLGLDLNNLSPNTDLISLLLNYLTSPDGLAKAVQGAVDGLINPLEDQFNKCSAALQAIPILGPILVSLIGPGGLLQNGQTALESTISGIVKALAGAAGVNPLAPIGDILKKVIDIGVNVQPLVSSGDFKSQLGNLPKQGMSPPAVPYSTLVRALEVEVLPSSSGGLVTLGLANAAAGPSTAPAVVTTSPAPPNSAPPTAVPTGVPAGQGTHGGNPALPLVLLALGLMFAGGGVMAYRMRGTLNQH